MKIGIVGGAGFIGYHSANYFAAKGHTVTVLDDFSRPGGRRHAEMLTKDFPGKIRFVEADISKDLGKLGEFVSGQDAILHLAAQVAVTLSVQNPRRDFEINALGTFNLLEAVRLSGGKPAFVYASTNKVYGGMEDQEVIERNGRYNFDQLPYGVPDSYPLDFHSPYGCSKGSADQYTRDYERIFDLPTVVLRQSCIYGTDQFGHEDQGWVAHLTLTAFRGKPLKFFGDGKQVRDLLFAEDLVRLYEKCIENIGKVRGKAFNAGGGHKNTLSLLELHRILEKHLGRKIDVSFHPWRPGDQKIFVCDIQGLKDALDWEPKISPEEGIVKMLEWAKANGKDIEEILGG